MVPEGAERCIHSGLILALRDNRPELLLLVAQPGPPSRTAARAALGGPARPLGERLDGFWSPGLSPARLRALATAPGPATPDLVLLMFPPPPVRVGGQDLAEILAPAYQEFAADDAGSRPPA